MPIKVDMKRGHTMSALHNILTHIDRKLESMIERPVRYVGTLVQQQNDKLQIFDEMCHDLQFSEQQIYEEVDWWLIISNPSEKTDFCSFIYQNVSHYKPEDCGREIIEEYCKSRNISLRK